MIPVQVRSASGRWCDGFELVRFNADGTATIRSTRTGASRNLPQWQWRDPAERAFLASATNECRDAYVWLKAKLPDVG